MKNVDKKDKIPLIIIYGATSSGKSDLAVEIAKKINGEIISADSRQVYKGINIASGKVTKKEMKNVPHHLLDIVDPKKQSYSAWDFAKDASAIAKKIYKKGKIPIIAGGTMFYIASLLKEVELPNVPADKKLRKSLEKLPAEKLYKKLLKTDPKRAEKIDPANKRRIIRALEIKMSKNKEEKLDLPDFVTLKLGIQVPKEQLKEKIRKRVLKRIRRGMVAEAIKLHKKGLSYKRMRELGLELEHLADFLQNKINKEELKEKIFKDAYRYARKQLSWWKHKNPEIIWIPYTQKEKFIKLAENFVKDGL